MDLDSIYRLFPDEYSCLVFLERVRWGEGRPVCPYCGVQSSSPMPKETRHHCNNCPCSFSVTVGTLFHNTKVDLRRWFLALLLYTDRKRQPSVRELAIEIGVNKNTASSMCMRIRGALLAQERDIHALLQLLPELVR
jgi:transposase-like protein